MKKLTLIRHAKSSWEGNFRDFDRPLSKRGFTDLSNMSFKVVEFGSIPDLVLSSPANRALTTAKSFVEKLDIEEDNFILKDGLYDFSGQMLIEVIKAVSDKVDYLMIFGHNHSITHFVNRYGSIPIENVPTCGMVTIEFSINDWKNIEKGMTVKTLFPKSLRN